MAMEIFSRDLSGATVLPKPELGTKHECPECTARFYDLNKNPAVCPKCGHEITPGKSEARRQKPVEKEKPPKKPPAKPESGDDLLDGDIDVALIDLDDDEDADEDALLASDDDDDDIVDISLPDAKED